MARRRSALRFDETDVLLLLLAEPLVVGVPHPSDSAEFRDRWRRFGAAALTLADEMDAAQAAQSAECAWATSRAEPYRDALVRLFGAPGGVDDGPEAA